MHFESACTLLGEYWCTDPHTFRQTVGRRAGRREYGVGTDHWPTTAIVREYTHDTSKTRFRDVFDDHLSAQRYSVRLTSTLSYSTSTSTSPTPLMLAATLSRSLVTRRVAVQSARCLATKVPPPKQPANDPPSPPAPQTQTQPSSSVPILDFSPTLEEEEGPRERTGARSSKNSLSSSERRRRMFARGAMAAFLVGAGVQTWLMGREWEEWELKEKRMVCPVAVVHTVVTHTCDRK